MQTKTHNLMQGKSERAREMDREQGTERERATQQGK